VDSFILCICVYDLHNKELDRSQRSQTSFIMVYCIVPSGVTIGAEAGMTVYGQCWSQISSTQCTAPL